MRFSGIGVCLPAAALGLWLANGCAEKPPAEVKSSPAAAHNDHEHNDHGHTEGHHDHAGGNHEHSHKDSRDHESQPHEHAESVGKPAGYAEAVRRIQAYRDAIREEIQAGRPTAAHRPLDELDQVLEWLPGITRESRIPKEHWQTVGESAQRLRDLFAQIHGRIDEGHKPDYASVAGDIDEALRKLESVQADQSANEKASPDSQPEPNTPPTPEAQ